MSGTWDTVVGKISETADFLAKETEKLGDRAKLRYQISKLKKELSEQYEALGRIKFAEMQQPQSGDLFAEESSACTEAIVELQEQLGAAEQAYKEAKNP